MADLNFYEKDMAKIQNQLIEKIGKVLRRPIEGLVAYHQSH